MNGASEIALIHLGAASVLVCALLAWLPKRAGGGCSRWVLPGLIVAVGCLAAGLALRWVRLGHGPFFNMFEILASNLLSLTVIVCLVRMWVREVRVVMPLACSVLALVAAWLLYVEPVDSHFAPTYATPVLWFHVFFGKVFLGVALAATAIALAIVVRARFARALARDRLPSSELLDQRAWSLMRVALAFETLMLISGAVWAQDAWGRYWAWDPLETWAFLTWITLVGALHWRRVRPMAPIASAVCVIAVFAIAFVTFFGVPFLSVAPHKGAI